jgi:hypothetical protein
MKNFAEFCAHLEGRVARRSRRHYSVVSKISGQ